MINKNRFLPSAFLALMMAIFNGCAEGPAEVENANANNSNASAQQAGGADQSQPLIRPNQSVNKDLGQIKVVSNPTGAVIMLISEDEGSTGQPRMRGSTPTVISDVEPGKYAVHLELRGFKAFQKSIEVKAGESTTVKATLKKN